LWDVSFDDRLRVLGAESLELRRLKADLILAYKVLRDHVKICARSSFLLLVSDATSKLARTRDHDFKLVKRSFKLDCRKYFLLLCC